MLYVRNVPAVAAFHAAPLGAPAAVTSSYATVDAAGFQLVVVPVPDEIAATIELSAAVAQPP